MLWTGLPLGKKSKKSVKIAKSHKRNFLREFEKPKVLSVNMKKVWWQFQLMWLKKLQKCWKQPHIFCSGLNGLI